jgi:hypothetical protein
LVQQLGEVRHGIENFTELAEARRRRMAYRVADRRQAIETCAKSVELARRGEGETDPRRQAFEIGQVRERLPQVLQQMGAVDQLRYRALALADLLEVDARPHQPVVQEPRTHSGSRVVENVDQ